MQEITRRKVDGPMPFASVNGTRLHYHVTGHGIPLICIHPPLLNQENFNYQRAQLADRCKIITFDIRGHGQTPYSSDPVTYPLIVEDMKGLLDYLNIEKAVLLGYSTGGSIALEAMLAYPNRFTSAVVVSGMSEVTDLYIRGRLMLATGLSALKAKRLLGGLIGWGNSDMSKTFENLYMGAVHGDIRNIRQYYSYSLRYNCTDRLHWIDQPVLLLYGKQDRSFHRYAQILNERLPNNTLHFIEGVGHQIPTKAPRAMHRIMEQWLDRLTADRNKPRSEAFLPDVPDFLPDAETPSAGENLQEL